jgi:hypothetical protein
VTKDLCIWRVSPRIPAGGKYFPQRRFLYNFRGSVIAFNKDLPFSAETRQKQTGSFREAKVPHWSLDVAVQPAVARLPVRPMREREIVHPAAVHL